MDFLNTCEAELKDKIDQWNVKLANPQMTEAGHDEMKNLKDTMDETHEVTKNVTQSASEKPRLRREWYNRCVDSVASYMDHSIHR